MKVEVSVIMGVYNPDKKQIFDSVSSVLRQTFQDFEFVICDDGSTVNTEVFSELKNLDPRIVVICNETNRGLAYSLNRCIEESKGIYLARQDADDISHPQRLEKQVEFLRIHPRIGFVGSNIEYFDHEVWGHYDLKEYPEKKDFLLTPPFMHASIVYRREVFSRKENLYRVAKETRRCEDYDLFMDLYSKGYRGANIQQYLYLVRENKDSLKRRKFKYRLDEVKVRMKGFRKLGISHVYDIFIIKPVIVGLIPKQLLEKIKDLFYKRLR